MSAASPKVGHFSWSLALNLDVRPVIAKRHTPGPSKPPRSKNISAGRGFMMGSSKLNKRAALAGTSFVAAALCAAAPARAQHTAPQTTAEATPAEAPETNDTTEIVVTGS